MLKVTVNKESYSEIADRLGVYYYSNFRMVPCDNPDLPNNKYAKLYFPMAEVYQRGRWRWVVITGRPYKNGNIALRVLEKAKKIQRMFLRDAGKAYSCHLDSLNNPIDNLKYSIEP